jgi:glutathione S-transferase
MTLKFYCGSGSQPAWRVWLTLEHKGIPYELHTLSFDKKETRTPEFLAINPRGKVPTVDHDGDPAAISSAKEALLAELLRFDEMLTHDYLAGPELTLADFAAYPYLRTVKLSTNGSPATASATVSRRSSPRG